MKNIIVLLIISALITSCWNKAEETTADDINTPITIETNNGGVKVNIDWDDIKIEVKEEDSNESIKVDIDWGEVKIETPDIKEAIKIEANSDEETLESEVNDLLDEFIDSLDSYDK